MLDALDSTDAGSDRIEIGWVGDQAAKADGHNNLSGQSLIPTRRTIPDVGQRFDSDIQAGAEKIISDAVSNNIDDINASDFDSVTTKNELYSTLTEYFPDMSRAEIRMAVTRSAPFARFLDDHGLFDLL